jgi:adenylate cyclase
MERKLAAILAGDVVDYSRQMAEDETATYSNLRSAFDQIITPAITQHSGRIFKTAGDGFLATFASANEALSAALSIQKQFADHPMRLRIGLNLGDVIEDSGDVFGDGVNVAARLESASEPGGIYVSGLLRRSADKVQDVEFRPLGRRKLKNMRERLEVYAAVQAGARKSWRGSRRLHAIAATCLAGFLLAGAAVWSVQQDWALRFLDGLSSQQADVAANEDDRPVVAVLPFANLSNDAGQDYFADGLTEDIIAELATNRDLLVIARNSTFAFKGQNRDIRKVAAELGARYVVEGSARRQDNDLLVAAQLIDAQSGSHLWSRRYDRDAGNIFDVQRDLTSHIVGSLLSYVRQSEVEAAAERPTTNARAYDLVLQARKLQAGEKNRVTLLQARALYQRALDLDQRYAAARAGLAINLISDYLQEITGAQSPDDLEAGLKAAREAVRLEPDLALGYQALSYGLSASGDYEGGLRAARRAVDLSPSDPDSLMALAKAQVRFGNYQEAVESAERARLLHPLAPAYYLYIHGQSLYAANRLFEADEVLSECLATSPQEANCLRIHAATLARLGRLPEARERISELAGADPKFSLAVEAEYRRFGQSALMKRYLDDLTAAGVTGIVSQKPSGEPS